MSTGSTATNTRTVGGSVSTSAALAPGARAPRRRHTDGIGTAARIDRPRGITADGSSIYFAEFDRHTIRQGDLATAQISTLAGTPGPMPPPQTMGGYMEGTGNTALFSQPWGIAYHFPTRSLFVSDGGNFVIRRIQ